MVPKSNVKSRRRVNKSGENDAARPRFSFRSPFRCRAVDVETSDSNKKNESSFSFHWLRTSSARIYLVYLVLLGFPRFYRVLLGFSTFRGIIVAWDRMLPSFTGFLFQSECPFRSRWPVGLGASALPSWQPGFLQGPSGKSKKKKSSEIIFL